MKTFANRLKALRAERGLSQQKLADLLGISKSSINMYERGEREPGFHTVRAFSSFFNVDMNDLWGTETARSARLPVLGEIACGEPIFAHTDEMEYIEADPSLRADFCLRAKGDSMVGARILDGDLVFIRRQETVENGEIAAVIIDDHATLKRVYFYPEEQTLSLHAENPLYPPLIYKGEALREIRILGKALSFHSKLS